MRAAITACDEALPLLNTAQLAASLVSVDRALFGVAA